MIFDFGCELPCNLRCHKDMGNAVILKISVQLDKVKSDILINDMELSAGNNGAIHLHKAGVKSVAGICRINAVCRYIIISYVGSAHCV